MSPHGPQNFANHRAMDHALTLVVLVLLLAFVSALAAAAMHRHAILLFGAALMLIVLANIVMAHKMRKYTLTMQDRIIRLEMRLRLERLLPPGSQSDIAALSLSQLIALRFASDAELPALVRKVLDGNIQDRDAIKRMVKDWQADYQRI